MKIWIYILIMASVTYLVRVIPLVLIRREIKNRTLRSFLYYVPYVTLSVMTVPAIIDATRTPSAGGAALVVGLILAAKKVSMFKVALACSAVVLVLELIILH